MGLSVLAALILAMDGLIILASDNFLALIANPLGPTIMIFTALSWAIGNLGFKDQNLAFKALSPHRVVFCIFKLGSLALGFHIRTD